VAIGDQAQAAGFTVVPDTGEDGRIRWGGREINRTRDYIAQVKSAIPVGNAAAQAAVGISYGTDAPSGGVEGDIYFQIITTTT
jgi:hypothetical protein